ncbi:DUF6600 domain-containing protein [Methylibium rhizosphaerae]|jgi:hypothetical protein|uniref:DUF6600 domain-containing protein n=1 Tax=Methylibium rhizosphaerae TaxID=2570323 RepID=UPI00112CB0D2|nr:DUF6600 domain-containing protein [Methylibium rhizosphaerae]
MGLTWRGASRALAALALCASCGLALAGPPARAGRLAGLWGGVTLRETPTAAAAPALLNWPVGTGNVLATGEAGRAEVWIGSSALRLDVRTEVRIERLDDDELRLRLLRGSLALRTATTEAVRLTRVAAAGGTWQPVEPGEFRLDAAGGSRAASATAWRGSVVFEADGPIAGRLRVNAGQRGESAGAAWHMGPPADDDFRHFVARRDAAFDGRIAARHVSPEMTGIEDLDSHGRWRQTAEFGAVWVPSVDEGWAPYRQGRWRRIEPWGWTWIDDAPWGFAPFHYGRWVRWSGHWCWLPGSYVARPAWAPAAPVLMQAPAAGAPPAR